MTKEGGGYTEQQVFNLVETVFYWKKTTSKTFIARDKSMPGFKSSKDSLIFLLGANATVDFMFKPMLICPSKNTPALKNYAKWNRCSGSCL